METRVLKIKGMTCSHCQAAVREALEEVDGVEVAEVRLSDGAASVTFDPTKATVTEMSEAVSEAGYEVAE